jgi:molybdopterin converting factor small subunit
MFDKYLIGKKKGEQRDWNIAVTAIKGIRNVVVSADNEEDAVQIALRKNMIKSSELDLVSSIVLKGADQYEPSDNGKDDCLSYRATFEDVKKAEKEIKSLKKKGYVITHFTRYTKTNQEPWWEIEADLKPEPKTDTKYKNELTMAEPLKPIKASVFIFATQNTEVVQKFITDSFPKDKGDTWGTANIKIVKTANGWGLMNYATWMLFRTEDGTVYYNPTKYSRTTSKLQSDIKYQAETNGVTLKEVSEAEIIKVAGEGDETDPDNLQPLVTPMLVKTPDDITKIPSGKISTKGFKEVEVLFADASGMGAPDEPALTLDQLKEKISELISQYGKIYCAITDEGQFQVYITVYVKDKVTALKADDEISELPEAITEEPKQKMPVPEGVDKATVEAPVEELPVETDGTIVKKTNYKVSVTKSVEYENGKYESKNVDLADIEKLDEQMMLDILQKVEASDIKAEDIEAFAETYYILREDAPNNPAQWDIIKTDKGYAVYRKGKRSNNAFAGDFIATEMERLFQKGWESKVKTETITEPMVASEEIVVEPVVEPITAGEETNEIKIKRLNKIDSVMQEQAKLIDLYYNPVRGQDQKVITAKIEELANVMEGLQDGSIKITAEPAPMIAPNKDQTPAESTGKQTATNEPASGVAEAPKKDSFDITNGIALGDGYIAQKDTEKDEIYVMDKSGQEVFRAPKKGFVDDVASLVDTLRGILHIQGEIPAEGETAPAEEAPAEAPVAEGQPTEEAKPETIDEQISQIYDKIDELYNMQVQKDEPQDEEKKEEEVQNVTELAELKKEIDQKKTEIDKTLKSLMDNKQIMINRKDIQAFILAGENPIFAKKKAMQDKLKRLAKKMYAMDMATIRTIQDVLVGKKDKDNNSDAFMFLNE